MANTLFKRALITGASSGIGTAYAYELASQGLDLVITARSIDRLEAIGQEIEKKYEVNVAVIAEDLSDTDAPARLFEICDQKNMLPDVLINNAGFGYQGFFEKTTLETYTGMLQVNVAALTQLTYLFGKAMLAQKHGAIHNIASVAGVQPIPYFSVYAATKSYVIDFSLALWQEWKSSGVRVSVMCPGPVETRFFEVSGANPREMMLRKLQTPEEVAKKGWKAILKNKPRIYSSGALSFTAGLATKLPAPLVARIVSASMKPK